MEARWHQSYQQVPHYFFRTEGRVFFSEEIARQAGIWLFLQKKYCFLFVSEEMMRQASIRNKKSASLFLQKKMHIFFWRNNEAGWQQASSAASFLQINKNSYLAQRTWSGESQSPQHAPHDSFSALIQILKK